jgi:NodT family efflux transporter outer membrane factor (OMF) lipoprotein
MTTPRSRGLALLLAGSTALACCAPVPRLGAAPEIRAAGDYAAAQSLAPTADAWPAQDWWLGYGDTQLDALMHEAIAGSPDLEAAAARLRIAQGYAQQAGAALLPSVDASASAGYTQQSENNGVPAAFVPNGWQQSARAGIGFSFDLDLWGRNRAALAAAKSDAEAARYSLAEARLALTTAVASTYAELARLHAQRDVLEATLANRVETLRLVTGRESAGLDNRAVLAQARSRVPAVRAELAATNEAIALTRNAVAALTGAGPDRALAITRPGVSLAHPRGVPANAAIDLIGRRPDIAAARAAVEADAARIKVARAAFYPNVSLSGLIGLQALGFDNLLKGSSAYGNAGPAVSLPIFHGGALAGQYRGARGQYDEAVARYDGTVVQALRQTADAMVSRNMLATRLDETRQALDGAEEAYGLARHRYAGGLSTYLDVLSAEEGVLQARRSLADLEARAFTLDVAMVRALGGGFTLQDSRT